MQQHVHLLAGDGGSAALSLYQDLVGYVSDTTRIHSPAADVQSAAATTAAVAAGSAVDGCGRGAATAGSLLSREFCTLTAVLRVLRVLLQHDVHVQHAMVSSLHLPSPAAVEAEACPAMQALQLSTRVQVLPPNPDANPATAAVMNGVAADQATAAAHLHAAGQQPDQPSEQHTQDLEFDPRAVPSDSHLSLLEQLLLYLLGSASGSAEPHSAESGHPWLPCQTAASPAAHCTEAALETLCCMVALVPVDNRHSCLELFRSGTSF